MAYINIFKGKEDGEIMKWAANLATLVAGIGIIGVAVYSEFGKEVQLGKPFERPTNLSQIVDDKYDTFLKYETGKLEKERFNLTIELDKKANNLYLGNYTQNWDKQKWPKSLERVPAYAKHTRINPFSKTFLLHPPEVKVSNMEQKVYLVPQYGWDQKAKPYEKHENAQKLIDGGEKIIGGVMGEIPIPYFKDFFDSWTKSTKEKGKKKMLNIASKIKKGYTATIIPSYIKHKLIGSTETAREYKITFDTGQLKKESPVYLLTKIILGDPSKAPHGSFPNRYGELETKIIEFRLRKNKNIVKKFEKRIEKKEISNDIEQKICSDLNKKFGSKVRCKFKKIDLNNDGIKELIVNHFTGHSNFDNYVFGIKGNKISQLYWEYGPDGPEVSKTKTKGYLDLFTISQYRDKSVPSCVPPGDLPKASNMIKWDGKKYNLSKERRKQKYLGPETHKSCSKIEIGKNIRIRSTFESKDKNAKIIFYKRFGKEISGKNVGLTSWEKFASRERINGRNEYPSMVGLRNYGGEKEIIAETNVRLKNPSSFLEIKVGVSHKGYIPCETKPERFNKKSKTKVLKLKGCSKLKK